MKALRIKKFGIRSRILGQLLCVLLLTAQASFAGVVVSVPTINLPFSAALQTGTFEVTVTSDVSPQPLIGAENVYLTLPVQNNVTFTAATIPTDHPYIFGATISGNQVNDPNTVSGTDFAASVTPPLTNAPGLGLLRVGYSVAGGTAPGSYALTFDTDLNNNPFATGLFDPNGDPIVFSALNGAINIVPEPSTLVLALFSAVGLMVFVIRGRSARLASV